MAEQTKQPRKRRAPRRKVNGLAAAGMAMGIGSAAIVAALLYANRPRPKPSSASEHGLGNDDAVEGRFVDET